jgi:tRNA dimethylallyltransferase
MSDSSPRFLAITGPTASGKTDLSLAIADRLQVEIVSMDSRQVYRGMDIGTDKVAGELRDAVRHHGLVVVSPEERYSAGRFARDVRRWIPEIEARGHVPVLVGGTGFFLRAVIDPVFAEPDLDTDRLEALRAYLATQDRSRLERWVERLDPERARVAIEGGPQRMGRAIEVALLSGRRLSWWHREAPVEAEAVPGVVVVLERSREEMDRRIDERVSGMVDRGLVDEVRRLLAAGHTTESPGMSGTGYREIARHLAGEVELEEAMEEVRHNTRKYARRQLTWFRHQMPESAIRVDATEPVEAQRDQVLVAWESAGGRLPAREGINQGAGT